MSAINCLYNASPVVFFVFSVLYERAHVSRRDLFVGYSVLLVSVFVAVCGIWYCEGKHIGHGPTEPNRTESRIDAHTRSVCISDIESDAQHTHHSNSPKRSLADTASHMSQHQHQHQHQAMPDADPRVFDVITSSPGYSVSTPLVLGANGSVQLPGFMDDRVRPPQSPTLSNSNGAAPAPVRGTGFGNGRFNSAPLPALRSLSIFKPKFLDPDSQALQNAREAMREAAARDAKEQMEAEEWAARQRDELLSGKSAGLHTHGHGHTSTLTYVRAYEHTGYDVEEDPIELEPLSNRPFADQVCFGLCSCSELAIVLCCS